MKTYVSLSVLWLVLALIRIPSVESWSLLFDGSENHWWDIIGLRLIIAGLFVHLAVLERRINR